MFFLKKPYEGFLILTGQIYLISRLVKSLKNKKYDTSIMFMFLSSWGTIVSAALLGYFIDESSVRYYLPFQFFGHLNFILLLYQFKFKRICFLGLSLFMYLGLLKKMINNKRYFTIPSNLEILYPAKKCFNDIVEKYKLTNGAALYWDNKLFSVGKRDLFLLQIDRNLQLDKTLVNSLSYNQDLIDKIDFSITQPITGREVLKSYMCHGKKIIIYKNRDHRL